MAVFMDFIHISMNISIDISTDICPDMSLHPWRYPSKYSLIYQWIYPLAFPWIYALVRVYPCIYPLVYQCIYSLMDQWIYSLIYPYRQSPVLCLELGVGVAHTVDLMATRALGIQAESWLHNALIHPHRSWVGGSSIYIYIYILESSGRRSGDLDSPWYQN